MRAVARDFALQLRRECKIKSQELNPGGSQSAGKSLVKWTLLFHLLIAVSET